MTMSISKRALHTGLRHLMLELAAIEYEIFRGPIFKHNPIMIIGTNPGTGGKNGSQDKENDNEEKLKNLKKRISINIHSVYKTDKLPNNEDDSPFGEVLRRYFCFIFQNESKEYPHQCLKFSFQQHHTRIH